MHRARVVPSVPALIVLALLGTAKRADAICYVWNDCHALFGCGYYQSTEIVFPGTSAAFRNLILYDATPCNAIPGVWGPSTAPFDVQYNIEVTTDMVHWTTIVGTAPGVFHTGEPQTPFEQINIDTEMLQLELSGGSLPAGLMIRESPTLASPGQTNRPTFQWFPGLYNIYSFFNLFTEVSLDGGQTWIPAAQSAYLYFDEVTPVPTVGHSWGALKVLYRR